MLPKNIVHIQNVRNINIDHFWHSYNDIISIVIKIIRNAGISIIAELRYKIRKSCIANVVSHVVIKQLIIFQYG